MKLQWQVTRRQNPGAFEQFQKAAPTKSADDWSKAPDTADADTATDEFEKLVHDYMISRGVNRRVASQRIARDRPELISRMRVRV